MTYRTPKQKISPLHPGRVRRKEQITKRRFLLLHKQSQTRSQEFDTRSQEQLANEADITPSYLSLIENGRRDPSIAVLRRIASAIGAIGPSAHCSVLLLLVSAAARRGSR